MSSDFQLRWTGAQVKDALSQKARRGLDRTTMSTVAPAKSRVRVKTRLLQGSIQARPAVPTGTGWRGEVGAYNVGYGIWQEIGTRFMSGTNHLRTAASQEFPKLAQNIRDS